MNKIVCLISVIILISGFANNAYPFYAYYTKINSGEPWEAHSRTGSHADLIVKLDNGRIVFHRLSSYLPCWETISGKWFVNEIIPRRGDGPEKRPDKNNIYSFVRLIHESQDSIVVHWRYFPDFELGDHAEPVGGNVEFDGVVHEYFHIYPDGKIRRIVRQGTKKLDDWQDSKNRTTQWIQLLENAVVVKKTEKAKLSKSPDRAVSGNPVISTDAEPEPVYVWHFDDGLRSRSYSQKDKAKESMTGKSCAVGGPKTVWKKGVSGTALGFGGYTSKVTYPDFELPVFQEEGGFTLEAWVAPGAYSICSWTAIAHQSEWEADVRENVFQMRNWGEMQLGERFKRGFFLGINEYGRPVLFISAGDEVVQITARNPIPLYEWSHIAFTYFDEGMLYLYVNGAVEDFRNFSGHLSRSKRDFLIGRNDESIGYVSQHVVRTYSTFPSPLGFESRYATSNIAR